MRVQPAQRWGVHRVGGLRFLVEPAGSVCLEAGMRRLQSPLTRPFRGRNACPHGWLAYLDKGEPPRRPPETDAWWQLIRPDPDDPRREGQVDRLPEGTIWALGDVLGAPPEVNLRFATVRSAVPLLTQTNAAPLYVYHGEEHREELAAFRALPRTRPLVFVGPRTAGVSSVNPVQYDDPRALMVAELLGRFA